MIHDIDLVLDLVRAPVAEIQALGTAILGEHEDCAQARLTFSNGSVADLAANRVSPVIRRQMQVWGPGGCVQLDLATREVVHYGRSSLLQFGVCPLERAREPGADIERLKAEIFGTFIGVQKPMVTPCDQLTEELRNFTHCVRSRQHPRVSGEAALDAMLVARRILDRVAAAPWARPLAGILPARRLAS